MQEEKAINAKSDQISYNMHGEDFQGYRFCTFQNIPLNVSSEQNIFLGALNIIILLTLSR